MAFLDIFKKKKSKLDDKLKRPPKGVFKQPEKKVQLPAESPKKGTQTGAPSAKGTGKRKGGSELSSISILAPHITEKASFLAEKGVYVFKVAKRANKVMIKRAIQDLYGLRPAKVCIVNVPSKTRTSRGKKGIKPGYKKALVYLKKDDKIEIV